MALPIAVRVSPKSITSTCRFRQVDRFFGPVRNSTFSEVERFPAAGTAVSTDRFLRTFGPSRGEASRCGERVR